jgi:hypothetical protein
MLTATNLSVHTSENKSGGLFFSPLESSAKTKPFKSGEINTQF